jgi:predicted esterase
MKQLTLQIPRTAHYTQLGEFTHNTKTVWLVCHGYGQLAPYFAQHFNQLDPETNVIIAPEGISKLYLQGFSGRVGASWMTKEHRLDEIQDYITYLDLLLWKISREAPQTFRLNILGFSQGAATVCRWVAASKVNCDKLVLWAGHFPEDVEVPESLTTNVKKIYLVYGDQDDFITPEKVKDQEHVFKNLNFNYQLIRFNGKHELNNTVLQQLQDEVLLD